jgi:arylsulfatase
VAEHSADAPDTPWLTWVAFGACRAPHQAPMDLIKSYDAVFAQGWDAEREQRHGFRHACDLAPTLLEVIGIKPPEAINGVAQRPFNGVSFAAMFRDANAPARDKPQYFEMFGHRGLGMRAGRRWRFIRPASHLNKTAGSSITSIPIFPRTTISPRRSRNA